MSHLHPHEDPTRRCLRVAEWPPADRAGWESIFVEGDLLDGTVGPARHWSEATREMRRKSYGRWLNFLAFANPTTLKDDPADRATPEVVAAYVEALEAEVASWTIWGRLDGLRAVLASFAPERDWRWLRRVVRRLEARVQDKREKFLRLRPVGEIYAWAIARMGEIQATPPPRNAEACYRDALIIAMLAACPTMRLGNLTMIEIGRHLIRETDVYRLQFAGTEMKARRPIDIPVPESLTCYLEHYLENVRPKLLGGSASDRLWITRYGKPMREKTLHARITKTTERAFGLPINPHLFRDCAVTTVAIDDPTHIGIAPLILGHTDPRTTERHYLQAQMISASRRLRRSVDTLRKKHPTRMLKDCRRSSGDAAP